VSLVVIALIGYAFWFQPTDVVRNVLGGIVAVALLVGGVGLSSVVKRAAVRSGHYWWITNRDREDAPLRDYVLEVLRGSVHGGPRGVVDGEGSDILDFLDIDS
jgi:hypothetical protein